MKFREALFDGALWNSRFVVLFALALYLMQVAGHEGVAASAGEGAAPAGGFTWKDTQGRSQNLADYRGKWVLVNFWATWCSPCLAEIPDLGALHKAHKDKDLVVIGVALDYASPKVVLDFVKQHAMAYPVVLGDYKMARQIGKVDVLPTTYMFDPKGKLVSYHAGAISRQDVEEYIRAKK